MGVVIQGAPVGTCRQVDAQFAAADPQNWNVKVACGMCDRTFWVRLYGSFSTVRRQVSTRNYSCQRCRGV